MSEIKKQEKYSFKVGGRGDHAGVYGPFDTREAADKTAKALKAAGLTVSTVDVLWTVSTARSIAAALAPKKEKVAEKAKTDAA